jgi:hypothetical protein
MQQRKKKFTELLSCIGDRRNIYKVLVSKPERKRPLGRAALT